MKHLQKEKILIHKMVNNNLSFIFFGTPTVASKTLAILKDNGYIPSIIITSPDTKSGRGLMIQETPVSLWAKENNIKCFKPIKIDNDFIKYLNDYLISEKINIDLQIVVAYGKILPEILINNHKFGTLNIHYSLLPLYRGASPLESALLNGDEKTGVCIQQMAYKLDSGNILFEEKISIDTQDTKEEIREKLISIGANNLVKLIPNIINNNLKPKIQAEGLATYCKKIKKEDGEISINDNQKDNWNKNRAFEGWPGVFFFINKGNRILRIKIVEAKYENNSFVIKRVIPEGKKDMSYEEFLKWN